MIATLFIEALFIYILLSAARTLLERYFSKSPLDVLPGPPSRSWLFGNVPQLFNPNGWGFHRSILKDYGRILKIRGALGERLIVTHDTKALYHIVVKDQHVYEEVAFQSRNKALLGEGLLSTVGEQHKKQRKMLNPVFSINHMREMIPLFYEVTERLRKVLDTKLKKGPQEVDILHWMTRTALELIGQSGMGYSFDSLSDDTDFHPYSKSAKKFVALLGGPAGFFSNQFLFPLGAKLKFPRFKKFLMKHVPSKRVREIAEVVTIMHQTSLEIIESKKRALASSDPLVAAEMLNKKDIISILMRANATASEEDRLTDAEVIGQVSFVQLFGVTLLHQAKLRTRTFVFAGMDTTSSAVSRILWLLSKHQDAQKKLREEIRDAQQDGQLSYDQLASLPYLDAVCRETLRVYPPVNLAPMRTARQDMILPLSRPVTGSDGVEIQEVFVKKGTNVVISILGANCDPDLWGPDSYEWKPERWLSPPPKAVEEAHIPGVYSHLMTFLGGGRACIGFKFSQLEMKVVLSVILGSFKLSPSEQEISWKMNGIAGPFVEGTNDARPQLPLIMSTAD